ncbi:MAG: hypothetical protein WC421_08520 [Elusimicrobiales bacterium]
MAQKLEDVLRGHLDYTRESLSLVQSKFREQGWKYFKVPLAVGLGGSLFFYSALYKPLSSSTNNKRSQIDAMKAQAQFATDYDTYKSQMLNAQRRFPTQKERTEWLGNLITMSCTSENVVPGQVSVPTESGDGDISVISLQFNFVSELPRIGRILARIESSDRFVKLERVALHKTSDKSNLISAEVRISTVSPKRNTGIAGG